MNRTEEIVGNIFAFILVGLVVASFFFNTFNMVFRDGRGSSFSGTRGDFYMAE